MHVLGLGTDITETERIAGMIQRHGDAFLNRIYTQAEIDYCRPKKNSAQHYAGRWAAKEAVMKCFGTGFVKGIHWTEIEVVSQSSGKPVVELSGSTAQFAERLGIEQVLLSISHCKLYATATAIAVGNGLSANQ